MRKIKSKIGSIVAFMYMFTMIPTITYAASETDISMNEVSSNINSEVNEYDNNYVQTIDFSQFNKDIQEDELMLIVKQTLLNANKYALGNWFKIKNLDKDDGEYYDLYKASGNSTVPEYIYRFPAAQAFGIAISLKTGAYDEAYVGVSEDEAKNIAIKLATSVAYAHKSNGGNFKAWGDDWQAAHWAYYAGYAAWLLWDDMNDEQKQLIVNMITYESNRFINQNALYWKTADGNELYQGDSKIEEDSWNSELLNLAYNMLPKHENAKKWEYRMIEYQLASFATPEMNNSDEIIHGKKAKDWVNGYNVNDDGTVINHGIVHPVYNAASTGVNTSIVNSLLNKDLPLAAKYNLDNLYSGLTETKFDSPPYKAPGGTMYIEGSGKLYYPEGSDWGESIYDAFANIDVSAYVYGYSETAYEWAKLHAGKVLEQQSRFEDGHTYNPGENPYAGCEEAITMRMGNSYMTLWLNEQVGVEFSNDSVEYPHKDLPPIDENQEYIFASDSTFVRGGTNGNTSYYPTDIMEVKNDGGDGSSYTREGYMQFDLSQIKDYPQSAVLYLPITSVGTLVSANNITNTIEYVDNNSWSEETLTFNNKPNKTGKEIITWNPTKDGLTVDISEYVKNAYLSDGKLSLRIFSKTSSGGDTFVKYGTSRQADPNYCPRLTFTYGDEMETLIKGNSNQIMGDTYDLIFAVNNPSSLENNTVKFEYDPSVFEVVDIYSDDVEIKEINNSFYGKTSVKIDDKKSNESVVDLVHFKVRALSETDNSTIKGSLINSSNNLVGESNKDITVSQRDYSNNTISLIDKRSENIIAKEDTFVKEGSNSPSDAINNGKINSLDCKEYNVTGQSRQTFFKFDLPKKEDLDSVDNIKLSFYINKTPNNGDTIYRFQYIPENDWSESNLTWNTKPDSVKNIGPSVGTIPAADKNTLHEFNIKGQGFVTFDVTDKVRELVNNGQTEMSIFLYGLTSSNSSIAINSKEATNNKPSMILEYKYDYEPNLTLNSNPDVNRYEDINVTLSSQDIKDVNGSVITIPYENNLKFMEVNSLIDGLNVEVLEDLPNRVVVKLNRNSEIDLEKNTELISLKFKAVKTGDSKVLVSAKASNDSILSNEISVKVTNVEQKLHDLSIDNLNQIKTGDVFAVYASLSNLEQFSNYTIKTQFDNKRFELIDVNSEDMKFKYDENTQLSSLIGTTGNQDNSKIIFTFKALSDIVGEPSIDFTILNEDGVSVKKVITPEFEKAPQIDKTELQELVDTTKALVKENYTADSWANLEKALKATEEVLTNENVTQEDVALALNNLKTAIDGLVKKETNVDKAELQELVNTAKALVKENYTADSWANLEKALKAAEEVLTNENVAQEDVALALNNLKAAIDGLVKNETNVDNPGDGDNNGNNTENPNNGGNLPDTGAVVSSSLILLLGAATVAAGGGILKKRKREE